MALHDAFTRRLPALVRSFAARLGLILSTLVVVACCIEGGVLTSRLLAGVRGDLIARGRSLSTSLAREAAQSLQAGNVEHLQRLAAQARTQSGVVYSRFFDSHGLLLASLGRPTGSPSMLQPLAQSDVTGPIDAGEDLWEFQAPVFADTPAAPRVGTVAIAVSFTTLSVLRHQALTLMAAATALLTLLGIVAAALIARATTRPLRAMATAAGAVARGDFEARVPVARRDELGSLAEAFNAMAASLAASRATLVEKVAELERANHLKSEFLATVSHELRTPLNVIIGYTEMLGDGATGALTPGQAEMVAAIHRYSRVQLELITNVLDFARLSSGRVSFRVESFALGTVLEEIVAPYRRQLAGGPLTLTVDAPGDLPELFTDRVKLREVVQNLVDNAVKFTPGGTVTVSARTHDGRDEHITIDVVDTGPGMAPEEMAHVFEPFFQLGESSTRTTGGMGLGLSIVRELVGVLGGTIRGTSTPGEGTRFTVTLPCRLPGFERPAAVAQRVVA